MEACAIATAAAVHSCDDSRRFGACVPGAVSNVILHVCVQVGLFVRVPGTRSSWLDGAGQKR